MSRRIVSFLALESLNVKHRRVLVRLDLNVPMLNGQVTDFTRIDRSIATIRYLIDHSAKVIILSHFGRPKTRTPETSLQQLVPFLTQRLQAPVMFLPDCKGEAIQIALEHLKPGEIALLENVRYYPEEEQNDPLFSQELAQLGDIFVNDAFSCSHRAHASIVGISNFLPTVPGKALEQELINLKKFLTPPRSPVMAILGGSKISTKVNLISHLLSQVDYLAVGGGMANTFLAAQDKLVGQSLIEPSFIPKARLLIEQAAQENCQLLLPQDVVITEGNEKGQTYTISIGSLTSPSIIKDIGPQTVASIGKALEKCRTVIWNGPVGIFEISPFHQGSHQLAQVISTLTKNSNLISIAGGGETLACLEQAHCLQEFTYTSTAGGAFLEWLEGHSLPGLEVLCSSSALKATF